MERDDRREIDSKELAAFMAAVRRLMRTRADAGLLAYDGRWLPLREVEQGIASERRRAWIHVVELVLLYGVLTVISFAFIALALYLCY
jgi:hypothetical protein